MRLLPVILAGVFLSSPVAAIHSSTREAAERIRGLLERGAEIDLSLFKIELDLKDLRNARVPDSVAINKTEAEYERLKSQRDLEWSSALVQATQAYGIETFPMSGRAGWPPMEGLRLDWKLTVGNREERKIVGRDGKERVIPAAPANYEATTDVDGVTTFFPDTLRKVAQAADPAAELAFVLLHEHVHARQIMKPSTGRDRAEIEIEAYSTVLREIDVFGFPDAEARRAGLRGMIRELQKVARGEKPDIRVQEMLRFHHDSRAGFYGPEELAEIRARQAEIAGHLEATARIYED